MAREREPYRGPVIVGLLVLLACQLAGEFTVRLLDLPVPGPVVGMVLLLAGLQLREPGRGSGLVRACEGLLRHLQLLYVPAGAGAAQYLSIVGASAVPLVAGFLVSWLAAVVATAGVATLLLRVRRTAAAA